MKMVAWGCCAASFFCANGYLYRGQIKQRQLNDAFDAASAVRRCLIVFFPVEKPLARSQIEEGQLRGSVRIQTPPWQRSHPSVMLIVAKQDKTRSAG
jgi:hypothetical protein